MFWYFPPSLLYNIDNIHNHIWEGFQVNNLEVLETNERIIPASGLAIVGAILDKCHFIKRFNELKNGDKRSRKHIGLGDLLATYIVMLCMGKPSFSSVHEMDDDPEAFRLCTGISRFPSEEMLRQRMDEIGDSLHQSLQNENVNIMKENGVIPTCIPEWFMPVDIDVTPQDNSKSHKEGVSRTYKGYNGMAPIMAYIGKEGYMINTELRPGNQHCQKGTPSFIRETISLCRKLTDKPLLFRMDSGNDAVENIGILLEKGCYFIIKRNLRSENKHSWLDHIKEKCTDISNPREGKTIYIGSTWKEVSLRDNSGNIYKKSIRIVYEITERSTDKYNQFLFPSDIEINMFWDNTGLPDRDVIELYHKHGESEQFHSEFKTDMDVERLPSGKFATNSLVMDLAMIAYNILRMIGQESRGCKDGPGRKAVKRRRLRTVIVNIIMLAGNISKHSRKIILGIGRSNAWRRTFQRVYYSFALF